MTFIRMSPAVTTDAPQVSSGYVGNTTIIEIDSVVIPRLGKYYLSKQKGRYITDRRTWHCIWYVWTLLFRRKTQRTLNVAYSTKSRPPGGDICINNISRLLKTCAMGSPLVQMVQHTVRYYWYGNTRIDSLISYHKGDEYSRISKTKSFEGKYTYGDFGVYSCDLLH